MREVTPRDGSIRTLCLFRRMGAATASSSCASALRLPLAALEACWKMEAIVKLFYVDGEKLRVVIAVGAVGKAFRTVMKVPECDGELYDKTS